MGVTEQTDRLTCVERGDHCGSKVLEWERGGKKREGLWLGEGCLVHQSRGKKLVELQGSSSFGELGEMRVAFI